MKLYSYVGPLSLLQFVRSQPTGVPIYSPTDVAVWASSRRQDIVAGMIVATFVVDHTGRLLIADRRSEHVVCAGGLAVRSAGEITFSVLSPVEVVSVSNQSTGYCPEPDSWTAVAAALSAAGLVAPDGFSLSCIFRRCPSCQNISLVKEDVFDCLLCGSQLPASYNVQIPAD